MKANRLHNPDGPQGLVYEDAPQPHPEQGQVLVRVHAVEVTPTELTWSTNWKTGSGADRRLPIPGHGFSGMVVEVGGGVANVVVGGAVYGLIDFYRDGAEAEYTLALPGELAPKPQSLDYVQAAAVPLSGLTAWQALFDYAQLASGQSLLVHGAAGGVGSFAVQFGLWAGAHVIGTASAGNADFLRGLGVEKIIDYAGERFETVVRGADVVLDTIGGETLERSWKVLKKGGILVSVVSVSSQEQASAHGMRGVYFIVQPNRAELIRIGGLIDTGKVRPVVERVLPLAQARQAYQLPLGDRHGRGKVVLKVVE